ncbi:MAG: hypothetical protein PVH60_08145 [Anaerolineales bacterium]|jgi:hypothetical protein
MTEESLNQLLERLVQIDSPDREQLEQALDSTFVETDENSAAAIYEFKLDHGLLERGELRTANSGEWAILTLHASDETSVVEDDLDLEPWGEIVYLDVEPDIPPEGLVSYSYDSNGVLVTFFFHAASLRFSTVKLEWGETT